MIDEFSNIFAPSPNKHIRYYSVDNVILMHLNFVAFGKIIIKQITNMSINMKILFFLNFLSVSFGDPVLHGPCACALVALQDSLEIYNDG